jgi:hypothetical protein
MNPNAIIIPNPTITTFNNSLISGSNSVSGSKMLSKHRSENVNNTIARSGGTGHSTNGQGLLFKFNYIMEFFQKF